MTTPVGTLIDSISERLRDPTNTAHTRVDIMDMISRCQMLVNARFQYVVSNTTLTTIPNQVIYRVEDDLTATFEVIEVRYGPKSLIPIPMWRDLWKISRTWFTEQAAQPRGWSQIGKSLLVIHPVPVEPTDLDVVGVKVTTTYTNEAELMELRPENEDLVRDLATALLLIKQRDMDTSAPLFIRFAARVGLQIPKFMAQDRLMPAQVAGVRRT